MPILRYLLAGWLLACLGGCNNSPTSPGPPSPPLPQSYVVSGILSETVAGVSRPLAGRKVVLWFGSTESVSTDQNGRYTAQVPKGRVFVSAWHPPDQQQPCLASAVVDKDTTIDVEVVPVGSSSMPASAVSPMITGFVYETTPQGQIPVRGVHVSVDAASDVWVAYTKTDSTGRFFLCRVNAPVQMVVSAGNGYQDWWQSIPGMGDMSFEIELKTLRGRDFAGYRLKDLGKRLR